MFNTRRSTSFLLKVGYYVSCAYLLIKLQVALWSFSFTPLIYLLLMLTSPLPLCAAALYVQKSVENKAELLVSTYNLFLMPCVSLYLWKVMNNTVMVQPSSSSLLFIGAVISFVSFNALQNVLKAS